MWKWRADTDKIEKVPFSRRAAGSLAHRVLFMSIALLGLPLLIHTFFLYHREYRENVVDAFQTMRSLAESRATYMEQMIQNQQIVLHALEDEIPPDPAAQKDFFHHAAEEYEVDELFYVAFDADHNPVCPDPLCQDPTFLPYLSDGIRQGSFVFLNPRGESKNDWLYVGKTIAAGQMTTGALVIATPAERFLSRLVYLEYSPYPLQLSLIDETGQIILSSDKEKKSPPLHWTPEPSLPNSWFVEAKSGDFLAVKIPVEGTRYSLMLDVSEKSIANLQMKDYFFRIASLLFFVCLLGGGILMWLTHRVSKPLRSLCAVMKRVSEGASHIRFTPDRMGFEINVLGQQLNQMLDALIAHQQEADRERIARERLAQELRIGHQIQASMLPTQLPEVPSLEMAPGYLSAREVSGDFYDLFVLKDGRLMISIADAADKGISACLFSLSFRSMLRTSAAVMSDLASIVNTANTLLLRDTAASSFFVTAWIGIYDPLTRKLDYCSQGHPPAYIRKSNGDVIELAAEGMALGIEEIQPRIQHVALSVQDLLFLYTDGVIEANDPDHQLFGKERLKEFLHRCKKDATQAVVDQMLEEIHLFCSGAPQADDLTLLAIRVRP
jgi:phosphoserine phosphatase RsbU/P